MSTVLANRLASREYIESRAKLFNSGEFDRVLAEIPDVEREDDDRRWQLADEVLEESPHFGHLFGGIVALKSGVK